jgi:hypothetical protein
MAKASYPVGDVVVLKTDNWQGSSAIVSKPIEPGKAGHVLLIHDSYLQGINVSFDEVEEIDETSKGFAQIAYRLIKLGSYVIEKTLI